MLPFSRMFVPDGDKGTALITALMVSCLLMMFCFAFISETNLETSFSVRQQARIAAFYLAEAGVQRAYARLCLDLNWREGFDGERMGAGEYTVRVRDSGSDRSVPQRMLCITSTGKVRDSQKTVRMTLKVAPVRAFDYACFSRDSTNLQSGRYDGPKIWGGVHTSGVLNMAGRSTVHGDVSASEDAFLGSLVTGLSRAVVYGDIKSGGSVEIAAACSVLAREESPEAPHDLPPGGGNVTARQAVLAEGFIQGEKRPYSRMDTDSVPFPEDYFDIEWPLTRKRFFRGLPVYRFESSRDFESFLRDSYIRKSRTYFLNGLFIVQGDIEIKEPKREDRVVIMGTLVALGDVQVRTPATFMLQTPDSTFPAIVALGERCEGGDIHIEGRKGPISVSGLIYAKGEIHLRHQEKETGIRIVGAECGYSIRNSMYCTLAYAPSVSSVLPFSRYDLLLHSWEEM